MDGAPCPSIPIRFVPSAGRGRSLLMLKGSPTGVSASLGNPAARGTSLPSRSSRSLSPSAPSSPATARHCTRYPVREPVRLRALRPARMRRTCMIDSRSLSRSAPAEILPSPGRQTVLLVLLVSLIALPSIPSRELLPTDEPRFALVARQMVEDPAPLVPHLGYDALSKSGDVYADKPPAFFWLISLFSFLTRSVNETSARLPSFLAAVAAVLLTRRIGALLIDEATGFAAAIVLATTSQ